MYEDRDGEEKKNYDENSLKNTMYNSEMHIHT
jgi:hypothetical protein